MRRALLSCCGQCTGSRTPLSISKTLLESKTLFRRDTQRSLQLRSSVDVPLERSVDNLRADIDHVWHDRLVLRTIPRNIPWLSVPVTVGCSVVLMVDGCLSSPPLSVCIGYRWVPWEDLCQVPVEQVWVVNQRLGMEGMVVHNDGAGVTETTPESTCHKVYDPCVCKPASHIEVLNGQFSDEEQSKKASELCSGSVVGPVEVRAVDWASHNT